MFGVIKYEYIKNCIIILKIKLFSTLHNLPDNIYHGNSSQRKIYNYFHIFPSIIIVKNLIRQNDQ